MSFENSICEVWSHLYHIFITPANSRSRGWLVIIKESNMYVLELISKSTSDLGVQSDINLCKIDLHVVSSMVIKNKNKIWQIWLPTLLPLFNFLPRNIHVKSISTHSVPPPFRIFGPSYGSAVPTRLCLLVLVWKRQWSAISIQGLGNKNVWTLKYTNAMILELKNSPPSPIC